MLQRIDSVYRPEIPVGSNGSYSVPTRKMEVWNPIYRRHGDGSTWGHHKMLGTLADF